MEFNTSKIIVFFNLEKTNMEINIEWPNTSRYRIIDYAAGNRLAINKMYELDFFIIIEIEMIKINNS